MRLLFRVFALCVIAGVLTTTALAEDNLLWQGTGGVLQNINDVNNWVVDGTGLPPANLTGDHRCYINVTGGLSPILNGTTNQYPGIFWDLEIGAVGTVNGGTTTVAGAGEMTQTGGTLNLRYDFSVGNGVSVGNPVSTYTMTGGVFNKQTGAGNFNIGVNGANGQFLMSNAAQVNMLSGGEVYVGAWSGTTGGTLTMSGTSQFNTASENFWVGCGSSGVMTMSGTSTVTSTNSSMVGIGTQGGIAVINMADNAVLKVLSQGGYSTMIGANEWDASGGTATITLSGNAQFIDQGNVLFGHIYPGVGGSASATVNLSGTSLLNVQSCSLGYGPNAVGVFNVSGTATFQSNDYVAVGDWGGTNGTGNVTLNDHGRMIVANWMAVSNGTGCTGIVTLNGSSYLHVGDYEATYGGTSSTTVGDGGTGHAILESGNSVYITTDCGGNDAVGVLTINTGGEVRTN